MKRTSQIIALVNLAVLYCFASVEVNSALEVAFLCTIAGSMTGISAYMLIITKGA